MYPGGDYDVPSLQVSYRSSGAFGLPFQVGILGWSSDSGAFAYVGPNNPGRRFGDSAHARLISRSGGVLDQVQFSHGCVIGDQELANRAGPCILPLKHGSARM